MNELGTPGIKVELGILGVTMELICRADSEAGNARNDDGAGHNNGAGPLDVFSKQQVCAGCSSAWTNRTISCEREPGAGRYDSRSTQFPSGSLCRCVPIQWWHRRAFTGVCVLQSRAAGGRQGSPTRPGRSRRAPGCSRAPSAAGGTRPPR